MAGAIAGTALVNYAPKATDKLSTITLTINNICNLSCPHCYLQYKQEKKRYIDSEVINAVSDTKFNHLVVVGKEPFVNEQSISILSKIVVSNSQQGKSVGVITNGVGLDHVNSELTSNLAYIDVSFDGGEKTYSLYRKSDFKNVIRNINNIQANQRTIFNALHVVNDYTIRNIDDMVDVVKFADFKNIMFSPYIETQNDGSNFVEKLKLKSILEAFADNVKFMNTKEAFILLDIYHLLGDLDVNKKFDENESIFSIKKMLNDLGLIEKVKLIEKDPIHHGFLRVTYDGYLLSPYDSLNPMYYKNKGVKIGETSIENYFNFLYENQVNFPFHAN